MNMIYIIFKIMLVLFLYFLFCKEISQKIIESFFKVEVFFQDVEVLYFVIYLNKDLDNSRRGFVYNLYCIKKVI